MSYDLATLNQAWFIACDECVENIPEDAGSEPAFRHILAYCNRYALGLLREAAKELNQHRDAETAAQTLAAMPLKRP